MCSKCKMISGAYDGKENKLHLIRIIVSAITSYCGFLKQGGSPPCGENFFCILSPYLAAGYDILLSSRKYSQGRSLMKNFLMCVATIGALSIGFLPNTKPEFAEAVFVMLFSRSGNYSRISQKETAGKSI